MIKNFDNLTYGIKKYVLPVEVEAQVLSFWEAILNFCSSLIKKSGKTKPK